MRKRLLHVILLFGALVITLAGAVAYCRWTGQIPGPLLKILVRRIRMPEGFRIELYASGVPNARSLALGANGTVFVGSRRAGKIYAVVDRGHGNKADEVIVVASGLQEPNGVTFHEGALYVADVDRVVRFDDIEARLKNPPAAVVVNERLPRERGHEWRYVRFGPDGRLYIGVGAPCNICEPKDERYATILAMNSDGSGMEIFARGVRNSVGFDWAPESKELWFTENGRDGMGDEIPPDELNHAPRGGMNFGFPYCHGKDIPDPEYGRGHSCEEFTPPVMLLPAHVAALGMRFYEGAMFPAKYESQIFIAEHGSWNRSIPTGYRVSVVTRHGDHAEKYSVFAEGWMVGRYHWGRPVDVLEMPDGALLVSDDFAGAIYRIRYEGTRKTEAN
jgi:glucose/arabinose dehydrogenase